MNPLEVALKIADALERARIEYAVGGSVASTILGEPRMTMDVDIALRLDASRLATLVADLGAEFYVPATAAQEAIAHSTSFNVIPATGGMKVDLFVLGHGVLDRNQLARRRRVAIADAFLWLTSAEDVVLRKLEWFRIGGEVSDRQWRDILGVLRLQEAHLDNEYLDATAVAAGLSDLLHAARRDARGRP